MSRLLSLMPLLLTLNVALQANGQSVLSTTTAPTIAISLSVATEEGKKNLVATAMAEGKPVENVTVIFYVRRTFGNLELGQDRTLDDGTAALPFPSDLPGGPTGMLHVLAEARSTGGIARTEGEFYGGRIVPTVNAPYPRALWTPRAPLLLVAIIFALVTVAWGAYAFVISQLIAIRKGVSP